MSRLRVLVCGSNYARAYLAALALEPRKYQLAGILARGSDRSQLLAALNGVPLYRSTDELPDNIDLACAAMSSTAWPAVLQLIRRRVHVLCEHPYPASALKKALALAQERKVQFHVNGHFTNLPAPQTFIRNCRKTSLLASPRFVEVMATERSLYAALDILLSALPGLRPLRFRVLSRQSHFVRLEAIMGKVSLLVSVQVSGTQGRGRLADGSTGYLLDQRLTVLFPTGTLTLLSTAGPVVWNSPPAHVANEDALWTLLCQRQTLTMAELQKQRTEANVEALNSIRKSILGHGTPEIQEPRHMLAVSAAWQSIGRQLYQAAEKSPKSRSLAG